MTINQRINNTNRVHTVVTRAGWVYRVVGGTYKADDAIVTFEAYTKLFGKNDRVTLRVDEIATVVEEVRQ
ncbi:MAG: hypothetical protein E6R00_00885 [Gammaproteobacteria bacterium]|nr:MAG: hypothetical protein E6R00_00885 [Gammaproteobacteria bacterium]